MSEAINPDFRCPPRFVPFTDGTEDLAQDIDNSGGAVDLPITYLLADMVSADPWWNPLWISDVEMHLRLDSDNAVISVYYTYPDGVERLIARVDALVGADDRSGGSPIRLPVHPDQEEFRLRVVIGANTGGADAVHWVINGAIVHPTRRMS